MKIMAKTIKATRECMKFAAIDALNDVVLGVGTRDECEEYARLSCEKERAAGREYENPGVEAVQALSGRYKELVAKYRNPVTNS